MKIPLFDIDWTLLEGNNEYHRRAFSYALGKIFNIKDVDTDKIKPHGKIDSQIILELLEFSKVDKHLAISQLQNVINTMIIYYKEHIGSYTTKILPGVTNLLKELKRQNINPGLLTGNIQVIGIDKLTKAGLAQYFTFGSFGDEALKRVDLIEIAIKKAEKIYQRSLDKSNFVLIADSVLDIECAKRGNVSIIAVATGMFSKEQLEKAGADLTINALTEKNKIVDYLLNNHC